MSVTVNDCAASVATSGDKVRVNITDPAFTLAVVQQTTNVFVTQPTAAIVSAGTQGPPGIPEEDMTYAKRVDVIDEFLIYRAEAHVGALEADDAWRIRKITIAVDGDVSVTWADGTADFTKVWDDHLTISYS